MEKSKLRNIYTPLLIVFLSANVLCLISEDFLNKIGVDMFVLVGANLLLFLLAILAALRHYRALKTNNPHAFVRSVLSATVLKLFVIAGSVFAYLFVAGDNKSTNAVLLSMVLYIIYTVIEVAGANKLNKQSNAGK